MRIILFLSIALFCSACFSIKPGTTKSGKKLYETFYVGDEGTQYFIKPLSFERPEGDEELTVDFTFRYDGDLQDTVVINFSLFSETIIREIDEMVLSNPDHSIQSETVKNLYIEKDDERFKSRNTIHHVLAELDPLFSDNRWTIELRYGDKKTLEFVPTRKSRKAIETLENAVFTVFSE